MSTRTLTILAAALAASCVAPEGGIDDTRVRGTVTVPPAQAEEKGELNNDKVDGATAVEVPEFAHLVVTGKIKSWGYAEDTGLLTQDADKDWYKLVSPFDGPVGLRVALPGLPEGSQVWLELVDLSQQDEETQVYAPIASSLGGEADLSFEAVKGTPYGLRVGGAVGAGEQPYQLVLMGQDPSEAGLKVGAYLPGDGGAFDATARGNPVGGTTVGPLTLQEDLSWTGSWELYLLRQVVTTQPEDEAANPVTTVDEALSEVYLLAGDFGRLDGSLKAGTWYSSASVSMSLTGAPLTDEYTGASYLPAETPLVLDAFAPLVIGWEADEEEPNDVPVDSANFEVDVSDANLAQDLGALSGPGFVDILRGSSPIETDAGGWVHDVDAFRFTVPVAEEIFFTLEWSDDTMDLDLALVDSSGEWLDHGATSAKPEVNAWGGAVLEPGEDYFLVVLGYIGTPATDPTWELSLEQVAR
ncbi:MAG: hypothetical protein JXX28_19470 [Deltaproteobacteria bacterium]|nr:hypothetical protein [Deltaproteobacteria bacterium]